MLRALLVVVGALGEAGGCLPCLSSAEQRLGLCRLFLGAASRDHVRCLRRLRQAYAPLDAVAVGTAPSPAPWGVPSGGTPPPRTPLPTSPAPRGNMPQEAPPPGAAPPS